LSSLDGILKDIKKHDAINCAKLNILNKLPVNAGKPPSKKELEKHSAGYRNEGNEFFKKGNYIYAYNLYTRSVACVLDGPVCAMAYANRCVNI
jgi:hypothetical protein